MPGFSQFMFIVVVNSHENKETLETITSSEQQLQDDCHSKKIWYQQNENGLLEGDLK